jgi:exosortase/archaeosortase family protein
MVIKKNFTAIFSDRKFLVFLAKFLISFCILYYGTIAMIGITAPGGYYSSFAHQYLDYVSLLRWLLLHGADNLLRVTGLDTYLKDIYTIKLKSGTGVHVGYDCIGYGVMAFWAAFIFANPLSFVTKLKWVLGGLLLIFLINIFRISLMLVAVNRHWKSLFNLDNHTWFNIAAYIAIFTMMWFFDQSQKKHQQAEENKTVD